jgi:hypothetical protein
METGEEQPFKPLASADPGTLSFAVRVMASEVGKFTLPTAGVTTYAQWKGPEHSRPHDGPPGQDEKFKDYVFTYHEEGPGEKHTFYFARVRPAREYRQPIASESYPTSAPHPWPDVLLGLNFAENPDEPLTIEKDGAVLELARVHELVKFLPGDVMATDFDVKIFMSHKPFPTNFHPLDIPVPTQIGPYQVRNVSGTFGKCLHGRVIVPEVPGGTIMDGYGTVDEDPIDPLLPVEYPATNHRRWKKHVSNRHQEKVKGLWMLEVRWAKPPRGVRAVVNPNK